MTDKERQAKYRERHKERLRERQREWHAANPGKRAAYIRRFNLKDKYGLTEEAYDAMLKGQGGVCAICGKVETAVCNGTPASLSVDHDHDTGAIRGLLCIRCNRSLHDVPWHEAAIRYLTK